MVTGIFPFFAKASPAKFGSDPVPFVPIRISCGFEFASATNCGKVVIPSLGGTAMNIGFPAATMPIYEIAIDIDRDLFLLSWKNLKNRSDGPEQRISIRR